LADDYDITEYQLLVDLALRNQPVPKERLVSGTHPVLPAQTLRNVDAQTEDDFANPVAEFANPVAEDDL
jgi:hypothetical protein